MIDNNVFRDISYGLYIVSTKYNNKNVGCVINTLSQVTSENPIISFSINKNNYTNEAIKSSKKLAISIISEETKEDIIFKFGYNSSKDIDKFENCDAEVRCTIKKKDIVKVRNANAKLRNFDNYLYTKNPVQVFVLGEPYKFKSKENKKKTIIYINPYKGLFDLVAVKK